MSNSTEPSTHRKAEPPAKPTKDFPLFAHQCGMWAKKIRKRLVYFGSWRQDPTGEAALDQFDREWPYLKKGETPPAIDVSDGCTLRQLANDFLATKQAKMNAGDLSPRTFLGYYRTCEALIDEFGKERRVDKLKPDDFRTYRAKLVKRYGVVGQKNAINCTCIIFNYAFENNLISKRVNYGQNFARPSAKQLRRDRNEAGPKLFERDEVLTILDAGDVQLKAMILLGVNCGFGNTDVASLPRTAVNLETGWVNFPRPKTEIARRVPLWPETMDAINAWLTLRSDPKDATYKGLIFLTRLGQPWVRVAKKKKADDPAADQNGETADVDIFVATDSISGQFGKLLRKLKINGRRGLGFYTLRHCFETQAGESTDQVAVDAIMGHVDSSMAANYRHRISDERLQAVVETVRGWLFPAVSPEKDGGAV